jgi:dTMP kinase
MVVIFNHHFISQKKRKQREMHKGLLVVMEGIDRCGKTTQCDLLKSFLSDRGIKSVVIQFPRISTAVGELIAQSPTLNARSMHLLYCADYWECVDEINNILQSGVCVILDRYFLSGIARSMASGLPFEWCSQCAIGLPRPNLTFLLAIPPAAAASREDHGKDSIQFQTEVSRHLDALTQKFPCIVLNANYAQSVLHSDVTRAILPLLQNCQDPLAEVH